MERKINDLNRREFLKISGLSFAVGGFFGIILGSWLFAVAYPKIQKPILTKGDFGELTLPKLLKVNPWMVVLPVAILLTALLITIEKAGL